MNTIRVLTPDDYNDLVRIQANAYPAWADFTPAGQERARERLSRRQQQPGVNIYGLLRQETLVGLMSLIDFTVNFRGAPLPLGGLAGVAVDLLHKKEKVARDMVTFFLDHYTGRGIPLTALFPFRPDFYKRMGWGWGTPTRIFCLDPAALPRDGDRRRLRALAADDAAAIHACYTRYYERTHGMFARSPERFESLRDAHDLHLIGYWEGDILRGYLSYRFEKASGINVLTNDMRIEHCIYETPQVLRAFSSFLGSQADQIRHIIWPTQEPGLHYLVADPRNESRAIHPGILHETNVAGLGMMYRISSVPALFAALSGIDFGGQTLRLALTLSDSFYPANAGTTMIAFRQGRATVEDDDSAGDAALALDVADFSALFMGSVTLETLVRLGAAQVTPATMAPAVGRLFAVPQPPICLDVF